MNNKPKVLFLPKWYPDRNDPQNGLFIQKHAKAVSPLVKVAVLYISQDPNSNKAYDFVESKEHFYELIVYYKQNTSSFKPLRKLLNFYRYFKAAHLGLKKTKAHLDNPDLIHVHMLLRPGIVALLQNLLHETPYILTEQWTGYGSGKFDQLPTLQKQLRKLVANRAKAIHTVSESLKSILKSKGIKNQFHVIPNVVEVDGLKRSNSENNNRIKFLNVSDLDDEKKNVSGLIRSFVKLHHSHPNLELHIIGGGYDESTLREQAKATGLFNQSVFLYGRQPNSFVYDFMPEMDFYVCNSNTETFSVATAEALIHGKPVIVTRCGGPEEFVTEEVGLVIEKNNKEQLEQALTQMIERYKSYDPNKLTSYAKEKFSSETVGQQLMEVYQTAIK